MFRGLSIAVPSILILFGFVSNLSAQEVERSGKVFHRAVCGRAVARTARCHAHVVTDAAGHPLSAKQAPPSGPSGYGPADLRDAYKITATGSASAIIALVDAYGYTNAEADLGTYRTQFGLSACTTSNGCFRKLNQKGKQGGYPAQDLGWAQESALDLDMASAMCPGCTLFLVEAKTNSFANLAASVDTAARLGAHAIGNSYGGSETGSQKYESSYDHPGVAITASSSGGESGLQFPATSPNVTAVGGTSLTRDGSNRGWAEIAFGSGGCSTIYAKPKWQKDKGCTKRTVVDAAAVADPATGVAVYGPINATQSGWLVFGGTSVSAPLIAGVYGANGGKVKYGSNPYKDSADLFDIISGGSCGSYLCEAGPGYDGPTGMGTPNGVNAF